MTEANILSERELETKLVCVLFESGIAAGKTNSSARYKQGEVKLSFNARVPMLETQQKQLKTVNRGIIFMLHHLLTVAIQLISETECRNKQKPCYQTQTALLQSWRLRTLSGCHMPA